MNIYKALKEYKQFIIAALFFSILGTGVTFALPYVPSDNQLDPACAPGDANCYVSIFPDQVGNSGKFLTTNGTAISWASVATGITIGDAITSGTSGSILFVDALGDLAQDNSAFFWDNTNNRLGIGTNSPLADLSVSGITEHTALETGALTRIYSSGAGVAGYLGTTSNAGFTIQSAIPGSQSYYLSLNPYGGDIGIGIGNNSPDAGLEIGPTYSGSGTRRTIQISELYSTTNITATYTGIYINPTINQTGAGAGAIIGIDYNPTATSIQGAHYAALFRSGNVGIGDATPASMFTVGNGDLFQVNSSGAIAAATGINSSGTINFSGLTASKVVFTDGSKNLTSTGTLGVDQGGTGLTTIGTANQIIGVNNAGTALEYKTISVNSVSVSNDVGVTLSGANAIVINLPTASATVRGVLGNSDWTTFNAKESALTFSTGLTRSTNTITSNLSVGISGGQSVIGGTAASDNLTLSSTSNATKGKILFGTSAYDEVNNWLGIGTTTPGYKLDINAGTISGSDRAINLAATLTPTSGSVYGMLLSMNTSGSAASTFMAGLRIVMNNGYTGSSANSAASLYNNVSGTGVLNAFTVSNSTPTGNSGFVGFAGATTTGTNYGGYNEALNGNINIGVTGKANFAKNSAVNIAVLGIGRNTGTSPTQIGGWFSLANATPTWTSAALVADNGDQTSPIFLARDNGTTVASIIDGGNFGVGVSPAYRLDILQDSASTYATNIFNDGNNDNRWGLLIQAGADTPSANKWIQFNDGDGTDQGSVCYTGGQANICAPSDSRLKQNIQDTTLSLSILNSIKVKDFSYISDPNNTTIHGFIAQELNEVYPNAVSIPQDPNEYWKVSYNQLTPLIVKSIQELSSNLTSLDPMKPNSLAYLIKTYIESTATIFERLFVRNFESENINSNSVKTKELCTSTGRCLSESQLEQLIDMTSSLDSVPSSAPEPTPEEPTSEEIPVTDPEPALEEIPEEVVGEPVTEPEEEITPEPEPEEEIVVALPE